MDIHHNARTTPHSRAGLVKRMNAGELPKTVAASGTAPSVRSRCSKRHIVRRYSELGSVRLLKDDLDRAGIRSKVRIAKNGKRSGCESFSRGALYTLLGNPIYIGDVRHKGTRYPGLHEPIVEASMWKKIDALLHAHAGRARGTSTKSMSSPLAGKLFDEVGQPLTPSHAGEGYTSLPVLRLAQPDFRPSRANRKRLADSGR